MRANGSMRIGAAGVCRWDRSGGGIRVESFLMGMSLSDDGC